MQLTKVKAVTLLLILWVPWVPVVFAAESDKPLIMQAKVFRQSINVADYWVSEKLDGVRARWNGDRLVSKNGNVFRAPKWFTEGFPKQPLDGELWSGRGEYQQLVSIVSRDAPHDGWRKVKFMVFDLPGNPHPFSERVVAMRRIAEQRYSPFLEVIDQFRVASHVELMRTMDKIAAESGEGLMLHHKDALYHAGRSDWLRKLKPYHDAEAVVIGYRPGKGKFLGKMGALKVRTGNNVVFYIGTGFSRQQRENPPPLGSVVTFRYQGTTDDGIPRFAVFLRVREEP